MLNLNDLKEKSIIVISNSEDFPNEIKFSNDCMVLYKNNELVNKISIHNIFAIFIIGDLTLTTVLIRKLSKMGISIFFLNYSLSVYSQINSEAEGNYSLRQIQYTLSNDDELKVSKEIVKNKIIVQNETLKKAKKDVVEIQNFISKIDKSTSIDSLRGIEGNYAKKYFQSIFKETGWYRRAPRTKEDIPNLLLDIGYTFLFNYVDSLLRLFGFDTYKGVYHQLFFQRKSLACDLMEPIRPLIDYQLVKSYNLKQINEKDFKYKNGAYFIKTYERRKKYTGIWLELIMNSRVEIYEYILSYYRYTMNPANYNYKPFKI